MLLAYFSKQIYRPVMMSSFPAEGITYWNYPVIPFVSSCH